MRMNWTRVRHRQRMQRHGTKAANDDPQFISLLLPWRVRPAQQSKAEQRRQGRGSISRMARAAERAMTWRQEYASATPCVLRWRTRGDGASFPQIHKAGL
jgi:hypothetical protein